ncbi:MAG: hypothetical protein E7661_02755 [Ruminococcaceae bacterium]|nr:hypothetical protein [Oscillospiraceae bacterium]
MNFNVKVNSKKTLLILLIMAGVAILGGILLFPLVVAQAEAAFVATVSTILAIELILLGVAVLVFTVLSLDGDANFFLYDRKTQRNVSEEDLTFDRINSRMGYYMTMISSSQEQLWTKNVLAGENVRFGQNAVYKPLVAYKMLYDLIELDRPETWELFTGADAAVISTLCRVLSSCGEKDMSNTLMDAYEGAESIDDIEWVRDFVMGNAKYIRRRMRDYVLKNIEEFY